MILAKRRRSLGTRLSWLRNDDSSVTRRNTATLNTEEPSIMEDGTMPNQDPLYQTQTQTQDTGNNYDNNYTQSQMLLGQLSTQLQVGSGNTDDRGKDTNSELAAELPSSQSAAPSGFDLPKLHTLVQVSPAGKVDWNDGFDIDQGENWLRFHLQSKQQRPNKSSNTANDNNSSRRLATTVGIFDDNSYQGIASENSSDDDTADEGDGPTASDNTASAQTRTGKKRKRRTDLDCGSDTDSNSDNNMNGLPHLSVFSLNDFPTGNVEVPAWDCFLCIDVDGPTITIKDMRYEKVVVDTTDEADDDSCHEDITEQKKNLNNHEEAKEKNNKGLNDKDGNNNNRSVEDLIEDFPFEIYIARKGVSTLLGTSQQEKLPRRQMRVLHQGDRICISSPYRGGLVLEYRYVAAIRTEQEEPIMDDNDANYGTMKEKPNCETELTMPPGSYNKSDRSILMSQEDDSINVINNKNGNRVVLKPVVPPSGSQKVASSAHTTPPTQSFITQPQTNDFALDDDDVDDDSTIDPDEEEKNAGLEYELEVEAKAKFYADNKFMTKVKPAAEGTTDEVAKISHIAKEKTETLAKENAKAEVRHIDEVEIKPEAKAEALAEAKAESFAEDKIRLESTVEAEREAEDKDFVEEKNKPEATTETKVTAKTKADAVTDVEAMRLSKEKTEAEEKAKAEADTKWVAEEKVKADVTTEAKQQGRHEERDAEDKSRTDAEVEALKTTETETLPEAEMPHLSEGNGKAIQRTKLNEKVREGLESRAKVFAVAEAETPTEVETKILFEEMSSIEAEDAAKKNCNVATEARAETSALAKVETKTQPNAQSEATAGRPGKKVGNLPTSGKLSCVSSLSKAPSENISTKPKAISDESEKIEPASEPRIQTQKRQKKQTAEEVCEAEDLPKESKSPSPVRKHLTRNSNSKPLCSEPQQSIEKTVSIRKRTRSSRGASSAITEESPGDDFEAEAGPLVARPTRKRGRQESKTGPIRIVVTNVEITKSLKNNINKIGGVLLDDVNDAFTGTHIIACDANNSIRRTPKLMIGICRTPNIVRLEWLEMSAKAGKPLPCDKFLILGDKQAEKQYQFTMRRTLKKVRSNFGSESFLLNGWKVHICGGVAGNKAPPEKELKLIVEAAGGSWTPSLSKIRKETARLLVITSDPEVKKQVSASEVAVALRNGAQKRTTSWLFHAIMTQVLDLIT